MAEITNPQVIEAANTDYRQLADMLVRLNIRAAGASATYLARGLQSQINAAGSSNFVTDGSGTDGRTRVTGDDIFSFVTLLDNFVTFMTQDRKDVLAKWKVNGDR